MRRLSSPMRWLTGVTLLGVLVACDPPAGAPGDARGSARPAPSAASPSASGGDVEGADVLVTVNGVPIREPDLHFVLARENRGRAEGAPAHKAEEALEKIIEAELQRQRAEALGLQAEPEYVRKLRFMEAPVNDFRRTELTKAFDKREIQKKSKVSDDEARKHFEDRRARYTTEFGVWQILVKGDEAKILDMKKQLDDGTPFEKVAATLFPSDLPETDKPPWDMGTLRWGQVPGPWRDALETMKEGEISDILHGPKKRTWIIKLAKRHVNESITFEQVKPGLIADLEKSKAIELRKQTMDELRKKAKIVRVREPGAMPPPPEPED